MILAMMMLLEKKKWERAFVLIAVGRPSAVWRHVAVVLLVRQQLVQEVLLFVEVVSSSSFLCLVVVVQQLEQRGVLSAE